MGELVRRLDYERRSRHLLKKGDARSRFMTKEYSPQVQAANDLAKKMRQRRMSNIHHDIKMFGFKHNDEVDNLEKFRKALSVKSIKFDSKNFERSRNKDGRDTPLEFNQQRQQVNTIIQAMPQNCVLEFGPGNRPIYTSSGRRSRTGTPTVSPASVDFRPRSSRRTSNWSPPRTSDIWRRSSSRQSSTYRMLSRPQSSVKTETTLSRPQSFLTCTTISRPSSFYSENSTSRPGSYVTVTSNSRPTSLNDRNMMFGNQRPKTGFNRTLPNTSNRPTTAHSQRTIQSVNFTNSDDDGHGDNDSELNDRCNEFPLDHQMKSFRTLKNEYTLKEDEILDDRKELLKLLKRREMIRQEIIDEKIKLFGKKHHLPKVQDRQYEKDRYKVRATIPHMPPLV